MGNNELLDAFDGVCEFMSSISREEYRVKHSQRQLELLNNISRCINENNKRSIDEHR